MRLWTASDAAQATGGQVAGNWGAGGVSIDTRTIGEGDLFVALKDVRDGHDFVADALAKGAAAAMVSRVPPGVDPSKLLIVEDVLSGLVALGAAGRARTKAQVVGITGSVGKTSTKEMLRTVLEGAGRVHAAEASYNNHWGVPLTLARMPANTEYAVIEIGMNHPGEIAPLAKLARPHVALITAIAAAHLEAFESLDGIAREKASIFEGLEPGGIGVLPKSGPGAAVLAAHAPKNTLTFGTDGAGDMSVMQVVPSGEATVVKAKLGDVPLVFKLGTPGRHFAMNALAVIGAAMALDLDPALAAFRLAEWAPPGGRGSIEPLLLDPGDERTRIDLIDDAFNANPSSLAAALEVLANVAPPGPKGRRVAVLGDMLELGPDELALHAAVADNDHLARADVIHCVGPRMATLWQELAPSLRGLHVATAEELVTQIRDHIRPGDTVLVKGSKGIKVSRVVDAIRKLGHPLPNKHEGSG